MPTRGGELGIDVSESKSIPSPNNFLCSYLTLVTQPLREIVNGPGEPELAEDVAHLTNTNVEHYIGGNSRCYCSLLLLCDPTNTTLNPALSRTSSAAKEHPRMTAIVFGVWELNLGAAALMVPSTSSPSSSQRMWSALMPTTRVLHFSPAIPTLPPVVPNPR